MDAFSANELLKTDKELQGGWVATDYDAMERRFQEVPCQTLVSLILFSCLTVGAIHSNC